MMKGPRLWGGFGRLNKGTDKQESTEELALTQEQTQWAFLTRTVGPAVHLRATQVPLPPRLCQLLDPSTRVGSDQAMS